MKKINKSSLIINFLFVILLSACGNNDSKKKEMKWSVTSPDSFLVSSISLVNGLLRYDIKKNDKIILEPSSLGISTEEIDFSNLVFVNKETKENVRLVYDNISGKTSHVDTVYNELKLNFKEDDYNFSILFRMFNDGYGFNYEISSNDLTKTTLTFKSEKTTFTGSRNSMTYSQMYQENYDRATLPDEESIEYEDAKNEPYYSYEGTYKSKKMKNLSHADYVFPFLYKTEDDIYSLISEANLIGSGYHGSMLLYEDETLKVEHSLACGHNYSKTLDLPFTSPYRVAAVGSLSDVVESNIYENILGDVSQYKPSNFSSLSKEEQDIYNYDWVTPGTALWSVLMYGGKYTNPFDYQADYEFQDHLVDVCEEMGFSWIVLDADWYFDSSYLSSMQKQGRQCPCEFSVERFKEFSNRTHKKGVKILVWAHIFQSFYPESKMISELDYYKSLGIDGVKIDFWDGLYDYKNSKNSKMESKEMIDYYDKFYQECAKRMMIVDCHGCNKPTSERRIYPNVISREAIYGSENKGTITADNSILLSLTRCVIGPSDFTPATKPLVKNTISTAHNMAICITMESGCNCLSGWDYEFIDLANGTLTTAGKFYKNIPSSWDETRLVSADPSTHAIYARRKGETWYVGGINNLSGAYEVDFSFLEDGEYTCSIFMDDEGGIIKEEIITVNKSSKKSVTCIENGGFTMLIKKNS